MTGRHADADRVFLQFDNEQDRKFTNTAEKQNRYFLSLCRRANVSDMIFFVCMHRGRCFSCSCGDRCFYTPHRLLLPVTLETL